MMVRWLESSMNPFSHFPVFFKSGVLRFTSFMSISLKSAVEARRTPEAWKE
jgi:hypothetical protein